MRKTCAISVVLVIAFAFALVVQADSDYQEMFFKGYVEKKIAQCQRKSDMANSSRKNVSAAGMKARDQLIFYQNNKERLVNEMIRQEVPMNRHNVEYFLIKSYTEQTRSFASSE